MEQEKRTVFLAAGGTGGHIFPAESLAQKLEKKGFNAILITDERYLKYVNENTKVKYEILPVQQIKGDFLSKIKALTSLGVSYFKSRALIRSLYVQLALVATLAFPQC